MPPDKFHSLVNKLTTLKDELLSEYECELNKLRTENFKLRARLAENNLKDDNIPGIVYNKDFNYKDQTRQPDEVEQISCTEVVAIPASYSDNSFTPRVSVNQYSLTEASPRVSLKSLIQQNFRLGDASPRVSLSRFTHQILPTRLAPRHSVRSKCQSRSGVSSTCSSFVGADIFNPGTDSNDRPKLLRSPTKLSQDEEVHVKDIGSSRLLTEKLAHEYELSQKTGVRGLMMQRLSLNPHVKQNHANGCRRQVYNLISMPAFDAVIGMIITANAITIGIETSYGVKGEHPPTVVMIMEMCFLTVYIIELILRLYAVGFMWAFKSKWIRFDAFLVFTGLFDFIIKAILVGSSAEVLDKIMLIRMLRLTRLARTVRLMVQFRTLWLLVQGLMHSLLTLLWTLVVIVLLCYCFSILAMELIRSTSEYGIEYEIVVDNNFSNLGDAMLTHLQFLTLDGIGNIYRPLISNRPELSIYVVSFIMLVSIALMNLVTAIMVESSLRQAKEDQVAHKAWETAKKKALMPKLRAMFKEMDEDGSGELDIHELRSASDETKAQLQRIWNMEDVEEIFKTLDYDESGKIDIDEFCEGMLKATSDKPGELLRIMKQCAEILKHSRTCTAILNDAYGEPEQGGEPRKSQSQPEPPAFVTPTAPSPYMPTLTAVRSTVA